MARITWCEDETGMTFGIWTVLRPVQAHRTRSTLCDLDPREREVMALIIDGKTTGPSRASGVVDELEITDVLEFAQPRRRGPRGLVGEPAVGEDLLDDVLLTRRS